MSNDNLDTLRPEVQEAMHRLENYLHITIDGKHFRSEDYDTIRAELLRPADENARLRERVSDTEHFRDVHIRAAGIFRKRAEAAEAELAEAQNTIAAQQGTMGALKRKLALAEGELAALKARIAEAPVASLRVSGWVTTLVSDDRRMLALDGQRVALVKVEE